MSGVMLQSRLAERAAEKVDVKAARRAQNVVDVKVPLSLAHDSDTDQDTRSGTPDPDEDSGPGEDAEPSAGLKRKETPEERMARIEALMEEDSQQGTTDDDDDKNDDRDDDDEVMVRYKEELPQGRGTKRPRKGARDEDMSSRRLSNRSDLQSPMAARRRGGWGQDKKDRNQGDEVESGRADGGANGSGRGRGNGRGGGGREGGRGRGGGGRGGGSGSVAAGTPRPESTPRRTRAEGGRKRRKTKK